VLLDAPSYDADFEDLIGRGLRELGVNVAGQRVLLKPNLVEFRPGAPVNTDPRVVAGAATALLRAGAAAVTAGEGPGHRRDVPYLVEETGFAEALRDDRVPFVDLNHDEVRWVTLASNLTKLGELALPETVLGADLLVSMPKLKAHHWAGMTGAMKNLFGVVPGAIYGWPKNPLHVREISNSIVDLTATLRPGLSIVDAVVGMEGDGPIMGTARHVGVVIMGTDPVAVDVVSARVMGLVPERLDFLRRARSAGLVPGRVEVRGERVERYAAPFDVLPDFVRARDQNLAG
jgi:uncharacterized protein (DUF362 family)